MWSASTRIVPAASPGDVDKAIDALSLGGQPTPQERQQFSDLKSVAKQLMINGTVGSFPTPNGFSVVIGGGTDGDTFVGVTVRIL